MAPRKNDTAVADAPQAPAATPQEMDAAQLSPAARKLLENARGAADVSGTVGKVYEYIKPDHLVEESARVPFLVTNAILRNSNVEPNAEEVLYELMMLDGREFALTLTAKKDGKANRQRLAWLTLFPGPAIGPLRLVKPLMESGRWKGREYTTFADAKTGELVGGKKPGEPGTDSDVPF